MYAELNSIIICNENFIKYFIFKRQEDKKTKVEDFIIRILTNIIKLNLSFHTYLGYVPIKKNFKVKR